MIRPPRKSTLFPYTPLFRSNTDELICRHFTATNDPVLGTPRGTLCLDGFLCFPGFATTKGQETRGDRKSTRLNSSHQIISYAVFCLKKKKKGTNDDMHNVAK